MHKTRLATCKIVILGGLLVLVTGCETEKSRNPLSPSIAGPIASVSITAPRPLEPPDGTQILDGDQPVTLIVASATTNGERPISHLVQVSADAAFTQIVYTADGIAPSGDGRNVHPLPQTLTAGLTYYWRARALDGANSSEFSAVAKFEILVPVVIGTPVPISPIEGVTTETTDAVLTVTNATVSGPAGPVRYRFEVASDGGFGSLVAVIEVAASAGNTTSTTVSLPPGDFFWRVKATDGQKSGPWSATQRFTTPAPPPPPSPSPSPSPTPSPVPPPPSGGFRTPDPAPGQRLPLPDMSQIVQDLAAQFPGALQNSCQPQGGSWEFMDRVVDRLRQFDTRWGYNWKRGVVGDPSLDVVDYHFGPGPDEGSTDVYIIDMIAGHCNPDPRPGWLDQTQKTEDDGTIGRWTSRGRF